MKKKSYYLFETVSIFFNILHNNIKFIHNDIKSENIFLEFRQINNNDNNDNNKEKNTNNNNNNNKEIEIINIVYGDFGCSVSIDEEFPFANLTGTLIMWDLEAIGNKHGDENGFSKENDIFGMIGSLCEGVFGELLIEKALNMKYQNWEEFEWLEYTNCVRECLPLINKQLVLKKTGKL